MAYQNLSQGELDYFTCHYGTSRNQFRGPRRDLTMPYAVALGGIETYGKFLREPYPALVEVATKYPVVNLGHPNSGLDLYMKDPEITNIAANARVCVIQITSASHMSNRFYEVHPRRNDRFLHASQLLQTVYSDIDFTKFNFVRHMLGSLQLASRDKFKLVAEELRAAWVARMKSMLRSMNGRTVLLWVGHSAPPAALSFNDEDHNPLLIDQEMIDSVREFATSYVEYVPSSQALLRVTDGMVVDSVDLPAARLLPSVAAHREISTLIAEEVSYHFGD